MVYRWRVWLWGLALCWGLLSAAQAASTVTLIYSGNMDGELEPCGCSKVGNLGGILRQATIIERLRKERPDLFFISSGGLIGPNAAHGPLTADYILKGAATMDYDAIGVQWGDLAFGLDLMTRVPLSWVASNWKDGAFAKSRRVRHGAHILAFYTWLDPEASFHHEMQGQHAEVDEAIGPLTDGLRQARTEGALTVLTTTLSLENARRVLPLAQVDVLLIQSKYEEYGPPRKLGNTLVLQPGSRGMRFGRVDIDMKNGRVAHFRHQVIPMPPSVPDAPKLKTWYADYNADIKREYEQKSALRKAQREGVSPYAGAEACQGCHAQAYEKWQGAKHAHAFSALERVNKSFDPACIQCHTVGFNKPGGYIDMEVTADLINVQCESCHGAGREHAVSNGTKPIGNKGWAPRDMCAQCHTQPHSPEFRFESYWPKIAH